MLTLIRVNSGDEDFKLLVGLLDQNLSERNGTQQTWYDQFNVVGALATVVVAKMDDQPAGCGCFKQFDKDTVEIKRMFVKVEYRRRGIAGRILKELEVWAAEIGFSRAVLETGKKQTEALDLYRKNGYGRIENFGQYAGDENSVCFAKSLCCPTAPRPGHPPLDPHRRAC
jgi:putative acetyltransferase